MTVWNTLTDHYTEMREPLTAAVTLVDLILYVVISFNVGRARVRLKVQAPSVDGPPEFQRIYRVQMNTLEQMALNLPLLWVAAMSVGDGFAALAGIIWPVGRFLYAQGYYRDAQKRHAGFGVGMLSSAILFIGSVVGVIASL